MTAEREGLVEEVASAAFEALPCSPRCYRATRGHHSGSCVLRRMSAAEKVADALADLLAARDRRVRGEALREAAERLPALTEGTDRAGTWTFLPHDRDIYSLAVEESAAALRTLATREADA